MFSFEDSFRHVLVANAQVGSRWTRARSLPML